MEASEGTEPLPAEKQIEFFCPTCNLVIDSAKVEYGSFDHPQHRMRIPSACSSCPGQVRLHPVLRRTKA